jgi:TetR/AcrR family transcriptional regulator, cholesterol catabolism regulator
VHEGASDVAEDKQRRRPAAGTSSGSGAKRGRIIHVAVDFFGRHGYEQTKWADVATEVDIGSTALYHYFESKQHCLLEIMESTLVDVQERFERIVAAHDDWTDALLEALVSGFDLTDEDVLKLRVLAAQHHRVATPKSAPREEAARAGARARKRDLEYAWAVFLVRGMEEGMLPRNDAPLLARALLGFYNSVWVWYRPGGKLGLQEIARFYVGRQLALLGLDPAMADARLGALARA